MKYEINFTGTKAEKEKQALKAVKEYMGTARYLQFRRKLVDHFVDVAQGADGTRAKQYRGIKFCLMLSGVQGYWPVRAVAREVLRTVRDVRRMHAESLVAS